MIKELRQIQEALFIGKESEITSIAPDQECKEYSGFNLQIKGKNIKFRKSKITPKKTGQFVTLWKRNDRKQTEPFTINDNYDFYIIFCEQSGKNGFFLFPKLLLAANHILSSAKKIGKRGFRVYPSWAITENQQAKKSQQWQLEYFIDLSGNREEQLSKFTAIFSDHSEG